MRSAVHSFDALLSCWCSRVVTYLFKQVVACCATVPSYAVDKSSAVADGWQPFELDNTIVAN